MATTEMLREQVQGREVVTADGEKVGKVEDIYLDRATNQCEWVAVKAGFLGSKRLIVPIEGAQFDGADVRLAYTKDQLQDAPDIDETRLESDDDERVIYDHYGLDYPGTAFERSTADATAGDDSVVVHEEELAVGTRTVDAGTARLRKWVETEQVSEDVTVRRDTVEVHRETLDRPASADAIGEEQVEVRLTAEEPVVSKQTIAKERVSLDTDVETKTERVSDTVRSEHVDVDTDATR